MSYRDGRRGLVDVHEYEMIHTLGISKISRGSNPVNILRIILHTTVKCGG